MSRSTKFKLLFVLAATMLAMLCCGTAGHEGVESGTGYSDMDSSDLEKAADFYRNGGSPPHRELVIPDDEGANKEGK